MAVGAPPQGQTFGKTEGVGIGKFKVKKIRPGLFE
jgi:hypothetical protein